MKTLLLPLLLVLVAVASAEETLPKAVGCPSYDDLPTMYSSRRFSCARLWAGPGDPDVIQGCNDCSDTPGYIDTPDGEEVPGIPGLHFPVGSAVVMPGCTFYAFESHNYEGAIQEFTGPAIQSQVLGYSQSGGGDCANGFASFVCSCEQKMISCIPEDEYAVVLRCDGSNSLAVTECTYMKTIGTSYTEEASESMSVSASVSSEISAGFFNMFSATLGLSAETGYDWTRTSSATMGEEESFTVAAQVPAGMILTIEQAVGHCGGNDAKTELFRIMHTDKHGKVAKVEYERWHSGRVIETITEEEMHGKLGLTKVKEM